jgi:hypothetical protein
MRFHPALAVAVALLASSCSTVENRPPEAPIPAEVTPFSQASPGQELPPAWQPWTLSRLRKMSRYELVRDGDSTVMKATARNSASGLLHTIHLDPSAYPILTWRWKLSDLPPVTDESPDDSPVRLVVSFGGDLDKLSFSDRLFYTNFRLFTGQQLPYAALMYIWGTRSQLETIEPIRQTDRIKRIVVERGRDGLGKWQEVTRDVREDYRRAFGEKPGPVTSIGIMTETDESAHDVEAYYGDISFSRAVRGATRN